MTLNFFSPNLGYAANKTAMARPTSSAAWCEAIHENGIEVWLDVVYNHTSEAGDDGPTYSYRGIDNQSYYLLNTDRSKYRNETGCGNTLRCDHPVVRSMILESLRFWIRRMSVDGFRFDLASVFTRRSDGGLDLDHPSLIADIGVLAARYGVRMIAEAWDIESYLLGRAFPGLNWRQWNGKYRDDLRDFVRGVPGRVGALMQRLYGSDDLFPTTWKTPTGPFRASTSSPRTTAFAFTTWSPTTRNTIRRTAITTPTAPTTTAAGIAAGRAMTARLRRGAGTAPPAGAQLHLPADAVQRHAHVLRRRRVSAHPGRQQQSV